MNQAGAVDATPRHQCGRDLRARAFRRPSAPAAATALRGNPPDRLGYSFDGCAPETLVSGMSVKEGRLILPDGMSYRVLVLPEQETMTPALLGKIKDLVEAGATVIGPRPRKSPSLSGFPGCDVKVRRLGDQLWGNCDGERIAERAFGKGHIIWERSLKVEPGPASAGRAGREPGFRDTATWDVGAPPLAEPEQYGDFAVAARFLEGMGVPPDFESDARLRYAHRRDGETEVYIVSNSEDRSLDASCLFRVTGKQPELWNAVTGEFRDLIGFAVKEGRTSIPLRFEPHQSFFIVFRKKATGSGQGNRNFPVQEKAGDIEGPWEVSFNPEWGGPEKVNFPDLDDWRGRSEEGIKFFSGKATYRKTFDLPEATSRLLGSHPSSRNSSSSSIGKHPIRLWLDFGTVKNIARVRLNGRDLGVVWCAPWRVDITGAANASGNWLEITVANLWVNRLIGDEEQTPDCDYGEDGRLVRWPEWLLKNEPRPSPDRFTFATWKHYTKNSPLVPSGLLGPVTIQIEISPPHKAH